MLKRRVPKMIPEPKPIPIDSGRRPTCMHRKSSEGIILEDEIFALEDSRPLPLLGDLFDDGGVVALLWSSTLAPLELVIAIPLPCSRPWLPMPVHLALRPQTIASARPLPCRALQKCLLLC